MALIDLSKAVGLKNVVFQVNPKSVSWVTMALQTITPEHRGLQQISIFMPRSLAFSDADANIMQSLGEAISRQWLDLDRHLVELWESHSIRPRVGWGLGDKQRNMDHCVGCLLPEINKRGIVDPI